MLFPALWAYHNSIKTTTEFTTFQLVYGLEAGLTIEFETPSLKLAIKLLPITSLEEEQFLFLARLDETLCDATLTSEIHKKRVKAHFDQNVNPRLYSKGDLALVYDQENDNLGASKFESIWHGPYIVKNSLAKGTYDLVDYDNIPLGKLKWTLLKKCYG